MAESIEMARTESGAEVAAIVLAAGKSTRMKSKMPKALHPVCGRPVLAHILDALADAGVTRRIVVVGHQADAVRARVDALYGDGAVEFALQSEQKGTGHAARMTESLLARHTGAVLVVPGDTPLLTADTLRKLIAQHRESGAAATLLSAVLPDAASYGRILRAPDGTVEGIVEKKDATPEQIKIQEINAAVYAFRGDLLFAALRDLTPDNAQGEYYLTDVISLLRKAGERIDAIVSDDANVTLGINNRVELAEAGDIMRRRILRELMESGVTIIDPAATYVDASVHIGADTTLLPQTFLYGDTIIGEDCVIGPGAHISNSRIGNGVVAKSCYIEESEVGDGCKIGPFANLRPNTRLGKKVKLGDFVETKNSVLRDGVSAGHLAYLGDAEIGERTNIGAGTITCNYDGMKKHRTVIGADAFIGSDTVLVAPVAVDHGAATAAGSVINQNVPAGALGIGRERQVNKEGWAARKYAARRGATTHPTPPPEPPAQEGSDR